MDIKTDLLIIGGGMAGLCAGILASENGVDTVIIAKGQGATADSSGAIDVAGYLHGGSIPFSTPSEGVAALASLYPFHPYALLGQSDYDGNCDTLLSVKRVSDALEWFKEIASKNGLMLKGDISSQQEAVSLIGTTKPTCLLQETIASAEQLASEDGVVLFLGFRGVPSFNPMIAAKNYLNRSLEFGLDPRRVAHAAVKFSPFGNLYNISTVEIARHMDHRDAGEKFGKIVKAQVDATGATQVALPPILGIRHASRNKQIIEDICGASVFELLGFPPSVPGMRLQNSLEWAFRRSGGKMLLGHEGKDATRTGNVVTSVKAHAPHRATTISAKAFLAATGKYIGGGLRGNHAEIYEPLFGLGVGDVSMFSVQEIRPSHLTSPVSITHEGHEIFSSGVGIDHVFRPDSPDDDVRFKNLFAIGALLGGYNYSLEKSGLGVAMSTGYNAGAHIVQMLKEGQL